MYSLGYFPTITDGPGRVYGEIYLCSEKVCQDLDFLESAPIIYKPVTVMAVLSDKQLNNVNIDVDVYVAANKHLIDERYKIRSGIWRNL